jgi:flagellar basal body-associated protein FliL
MENLEPLLKEKEDKFYFVNEEKPKKNKNKIEIIVTSIVSAIVLWLMWYCLYPFYVGFVNYDEGHKTKEVVKNEEEINANSALVNELISYFDVTNDNELSNLLAIYSSNEITSNAVSSEQKLMVVFKSLGITCSGNEVIKGLEEIKSEARKIFNDDTFAEDLNISLDGYSITYNETNNNYTIKLNSCPASEDFIVKSVVKATNADDEIYIYQAFGYFVKGPENKYFVYDSALKTNQIGEFIDEAGTKEFNEVEKLKQFKWTFKKSSDNNYYFVSVTPVI